MLCSGIQSNLSYHKGASEMTVLFVGNTYKNTGPSNVNKAYKKHLEKKVAFLHFRCKPLLMLEIIAGVVRASVIIISGLGYSSYVSAKLAKMLKKPVAYLMHGCYEHECILNRVSPLPRDIGMESTIMEAADQIVCVSERFAQWLSSRYPNYTEKITYINTGVDWESNLKNSEQNHNPMFIITMGGGWPRKNNYIISEAVEHLNKVHNKNYRLFVLGSGGDDLDKIQRNPHTTVLGQVDGDEVKKHLKTCKLFVQNSIHESFSLGVIEALNSGCDILVSKGVGALSIFEDIEPNDVINDCMDVHEVATKILYLSEHENNERIVNSIDKVATSMEASADSLYDLAVGLVRKRQKEPSDSGYRF